MLIFTLAQYKTAPFLGCAVSAKQVLCVLALVIFIFAWAEMSDTGDGNKEEQQNAALVDSHVLVAHSVFEVLLHPGDLWTSYENRRVYCALCVCSKWFVRLQVSEGGNKNEAKEEQFDVSFAFKAR